MHRLVLTMVVEDEVGKPGNVMNLNVVRQYYIRIRWNHRFPMPLAQHKRPVELEKRIRS